jgi:Ca-activated chloride channel family protein
VKVEIDTKRPLKSIYSPSHSVEIRRDGPNHATAGYEGANVLPDADFALYFSPEKDELGINLLTHKNGSGDGYFLLLASPGVDVKERQIVMKDVVFVLDTSGSMAGKKLDQAKKALAFCVENLNDCDRFEILRFSTEVEPLFDRLVEANRQNRDKAGQFAKELKAIGGTAIDDALRKALAFQSRRSQGEDASSSLPSHSELGAGTRPYVIIFLTDGQPTIGVTAEDQILANLNKESDGHTRIFCFGIGTDVNTHLLDRITEQTHAFSQYVLPEEDLEVKVSTFFSKIKEPVLSDPTLEFSGDVRISKLYPSPLPDLFKGEQLVLVGRYSGQDHSAAKIEGTVNGAARKFTCEVRFPAESGENDFIPRLWATRRVGYLLDEIRLHGENLELREEVSDLARQYAIVTPYTAYLILEDEKQREVPIPLRSMQNFERDRALRDGVAQSWQQFSKDQSGDAGVASALSGSALKSAIAAAPAAASADALFFRRNGPAPALNGGTIEPGLESSEARLAHSSQAAQFVAGKTFFQNDKQWLDSAVQKQPNAKRVRIRFASSEYFDFLAGNPQATPWLALGQNVQFVLNNAIYEIYE